MLMCIKIHSFVIVHQVWIHPVRGERTLPLVNEGLKYLIDNQYFLISRGTETCGEWLLSLATKTLVYFYACFTVRSSDLGPRSDLGPVT